MSAMLRIASFSTALVLTLGGCAASSGDYPSLAVRDVERVDGSFASPERKAIQVPEVEIDLDGTLDVVLPALVSRTEEAHAEFVRLAPRAQRLVASASNTAEGSPAWASAQVALAELDSARSVAAVPLGDIDTLYTAKRVAAEDVTAIEQARERIVALISEEDRTLAQLRERAD
ncbi:hypothetical protein [Qipengyuania seohaensis]|uniref:hypothetical protein n=1 Tax=Qipengyuania seohaensis TaxID=266951 RepID=UPI0018E25A82|nr:hypothetical protein [Qipengyuania seohaensis]